MLSPTCSNLAAVSFPGVEIVEEEVINEHVVWEIMSKDLAQSAAHLYKKQFEKNYCKGTGILVIDYDNFIELYFCLDVGTCNYYKKRGKSKHFYYCNCDENDFKRSCVFQTVSPR